MQNGGEGGSYIALVRRKEGNKRVSVTDDQVPVSWFRKMFALGPSRKAVLRAIDPNLPLAKLTAVTDARVPDTLLQYHQKQTIKGFKFGVLYAAPGQTKEDEMFANTTSSPEFEEFLDFLGDRVTLNGWDKFRGGLDVRDGSTGETSVFTVFQNNEIMFHVSTLLPYQEADKQQLERKRHIGNDIVIIIYQDGDTIYRPTTISSRQIHVVFLIKSHMKDGKRFYSLAVISREEVPLFAPDLPPEPMFEKGDEFRTFLYTKLLNAERACYEAPVLFNKLSRTRNALLTDLACTFLGQSTS